MSDSNNTNQDSKFQLKKIIPIVLVIITLLGLGYAVNVNNKQIEENRKAADMQIAKQKEEQAKEDAKKKAEEDARKAEQAAKEKAEAEQKEKDRQIASDKALEILSTLPKQYDQIEEKGWYKPYGEYLPNSDTCTWYVGKQGDHVWMRGLLSFFTESGHMISEWSISKIIFASSAGKYTLTMKEGSGIATETPDGAKFKRKGTTNWRDHYHLDCDFSTLKPGYEILANGSNPVIRYYHNNGAYDQYVSQADVNSISTALALYEYFNVLGNKL